MHYRICTINYSKLCDFFLLSKILYIIQIILIKLNLTNHYYLNNSNRLLINKLLNLISNKYNLALIKSPKIGYNLKKITIKKILFLDKNSKININNEADYENIMWSVLFTNRIVPKTINLIKKQTRINLAESFKQ